VLKVELARHRETDDLLGAQQESAIRVHVSSPSQHRHRGCRQKEENFSYAIIPGAVHDSGRRWQIE